MSVAQLPLALRMAAAADFDSFVGADALLRQAMRDWARGGSTGNLLLLGPAGSGKTHLLLAACAEANRHGIEVVYLPLAEFAEHAAGMLDAQPPARLIAIDDLHLADGHAELQRALFALHNRQHDGNGRLLYAAQRGPAEWAQALPDLASRLGQATRLQLHALDESQRRAWLVQQAQQRGLELDEAAVEYLFRRVGRDLRTLANLLERIDQASLAAQRRVTVPFLRGIVGER